jgi:Cof subfamily protein (haloacid dehalogenase superfamily)
MQSKRITLICAGDVIQRLSQKAMASNQRILISDIDGTLVTHDKVLTERSVSAAAELRMAGIRLTIISSRPPRGMKHLIEPLKITEPIAAFNGGMVVRPDLSVIEQRLVPAEAARACIAIIQQHGLHPWLWTTQEWYVLDPQGPHVAREQNTVRFLATPTKSFEPHIGLAGKIVGVSDDFDAVIRCEAAVHAALGDHVAASRSQPYYLDITHPDADKGRAVLALSNILHIPTENMITIGDMPGDVFMFEKSGVSIAMGNAPSEVQKKATFVTTTNEDEGFANAVERFVLSARASG